jgi:hypothetical protein
MQMSWRRILRAVYWDDLDEDEMRSKAEEITHALRRSQNDPKRIPDDTLRGLVLEAYHEVEL